MSRVSSICIVVLFSVLIGYSTTSPAAWKWGKKKDDKKEEKKPDDKSGKDEKSFKDLPPLPDDPESRARARARSLIAAVEKVYSGAVFVGGKIDEDPSHRPYNPDGSRNQNFYVAPDYANTEGAEMLNADRKRALALKQLIEMGLPAAPELCRAMVTGGYRYRHFYAYALGEIGDPRAAPALIKYMEDGKSMIEVSEAIKATGDTTHARELETRGRRMMSQGAGALGQITGESYGPDLAEWKAWWERHKAEIGETPNLKTFNVNPDSPKVHYDPETFKPD